MVSKYQDSFDAGSYMPLMFTMFAILFSAHMMACLWWFIGTSDGERTIFACANADCSATVANGTEAVLPWAKVDPMWCGSTNEELSDCATRVDMTEVALGARYIRSMFNIFNKEVVNTEAEHFFAVVSELVVGFIYGGLAGVISSLMMNSGASEQEMVQKMVALKSWMKSKNMTKKMRMKIQAHFEAQTDGGLLNESEILSTLPASLSSEISMFMYYVHVKSIPIFKGMGDEVIKKLCDCVQAMKARKDQVVFEEGSIGSIMYFIIDGEVEISKFGERLGFLGKGAFFGEQPIIDTITGKGGDDSEVRKRTVTAVTDTNLGFIHADAVADLYDKYPELQVRLAHFANMGKQLSAKGKNKASTAKMKVATLLLRAQQAKEAGTLTSPRRLEEGRRLYEEAMTVMAEAARTGLHDDASTGMFTEAAKAVEDAIGITQQREALIELLVAHAETRLDGPLREDELAELRSDSIPRLQKKLLAAGVSEQIIDEVSAEAKAPPAKGFETPAPPDAPRIGGVQPTPRKSKLPAKLIVAEVGDDQAILAMLRQMQSSQEATRKELLDQIGQLRGELNEAKRVIGSG
eukprot:COSAG05_NODE_1744_length_4158_cov_8.451589_3_plen_578_part_00